MWKQLWQGNPGNKQSPACGGYVRRRDGYPKPCEARHMDTDTFIYFIINHIFSFVKNIFSPFVTNRFCHPPLQGSGDGVKYNYDQLFQSGCGESS